MGELHLGGICIRKRRVIIEDSHCLEATHHPFSFFGRFFLGSYISAPGWLHEFWCFALSGYKGGGHKRTTRADVPVLPGPKFTPAAES